MIMKNREKFMEQFKRLPTIQSQLPVEFGNGAMFEEFNGKCNGCHETIEENNFRGIINKIEEESVSPDNSLKIEETADLIAYGCCSECHEITPFRYLLSAPEGRLTLSEVTETGIKKHKSKPFDYDNYLRNFL